MSADDESRGLELPGNPEIVPSDEIKVTEGPRAEQIDADHVEDLQESIELEGLIEPLVTTPSSEADFSHEIVDGRHRFAALENMGIRELAIYELPGGRDYAVPTREDEADIEIQSMAANVLRREQTKFEEARFLNSLINDRIISEMDEEDFKELPDIDDINLRGSRVTPNEDDLRGLQLLYHFDNITDDEANVKDGKQWKYDNGDFYELERIRSAVNIGAPRTEAERIEFYIASPPEVVEAWKNQEISYEHVRHLPLIEQDDLLELALEKSQSEENGYSGADVEKIKKVSQKDAPKTYQDILNQEVEDLDNAVEQAEQEAAKEEEPPEGPESPEKPEEPTKSLEEIKKELDQDQIDELKNLAKFFSDYYEFDDWEDLLEEINKEYDDSQIGIDALKNRKSNLLQREDLENYDWDDSLADRDDDLHEARPLENGPIHCFFHDCRDMKEEIGNEDVDLFVFSPPYFTQRETIPAEDWYKGDGPVDSPDKLDEAYRDFLDDMREVFDTLHTHLAEGGHIIFIVADSQAAYEGGDRKPRYDVPSDLSYVIRNELNPTYDASKKLEYENTIIRDRGYGKGVEKFLKDSDPANFSPNDTTERILVFRKGSSASTGFEYDNIEQFREYFDSLWKVNSETEGPHPAAFPIDLVKPLIELYSAPGQTVADPMAGGGTTLRAVSELNDKYASEAPRTAYGWENFKSEDYSDMDYWTLNYLGFMPSGLEDSELTGLDAFRSDPMKP